MGCLNVQAFQVRKSSSFLLNQSYCFSTWGIDSKKGENEQVPTTLSHAKKIDVSQVFSGYANLLPYV